MDSLQNLENAVNIFYKSQSTDQAQLNEYLIAQQRSPLGEIYRILIFRFFIMKFFLNKSLIFSVAMVLGVLRLYQEC